MAISRGVLSTDPQYKEWLQKFNRENRRNAEQKTAQRKEKENRSLTADEEKKVTRFLDKYNKEMCKRYKLKALPAGIEIR